MSDVTGGRPAPPLTIDLGEYRRVALLGGVYSNHLALSEALKIAAARNVDAVLALGDFGGFGPHPDRTLEILRGAGVDALQGNYEQSLSGGADDCGCGYTDPRDNHYAQISYDYTRARTAADHTRWMATLPGHLRLTVAGRRVLLCHGSPRKVNEFLWSSTTPAPFIQRMLREHDADVIACTHTGIHWQRFVEDGRGVVNVGALGRPANDGATHVWFAILEATGTGLRVEHVPVPYDHPRLAAEMRAEGLPEEFVETVLTGWWTTCLEILPAKERGLGRH
jgi:diadenosine tetraphosphatase ApaH/serine/threonine PP2A family protein phosphatase